MTPQEVREAVFDMIAMCQGTQAECERCIMYRVCTGFATCDWTDVIPKEN